MDEQQMLAEAHSAGATAEAANAVAVAEEARLKAIAAQLITVQEQGAEKLANVVANTMKEGFRYAFTTDTGEIRKFVDSSQVHRICDDVEKNRRATEAIDRKMEAWEEDRVTKADFLLLQQRSNLIGYILGTIGMTILLAIVGAIMALILK